MNGTLKASNNCVLNVTTSLSFQDLLTDNSRMTLKNCILELAMKTLEPNSTSERRVNERFTLRPDVSRVVVHSDGELLEGHVYDLSGTGIRLELDNPLEMGKQVEVDFFFAGILKAIHFAGIITRVFDEIDDPGPRRMGIEIQSFASENDELRMNDLLESASLGKLR